MNGTFLSQFWKSADLWNLVEAQSQLAKGFNELVFNLQRDQQPHQKSLIAITIWTIWKCRNELIWEHIYSHSPRYPSLKPCSSHHSGSRSGLPNPPPPILQHLHHTRAISTPPYSQINSHSVSGYACAIQTEASKKLKQRSSMVYQLLLKLKHLLCKRVLNGSNH